ncbi:MAG TPA: hypothetical protein VJS12_06485 [Steroidobacteraceae bacterium]|nr:hypothetical protein [Steroidobacteraceae bacterium]
MSEPTDIKALDEYLKRDSEVSERYRELGSDDVPPELDRRVLAAARDAVANEGARRSRSWLRWSAPVALAASFVLVVTVVLEGGLQDEKPVALPPVQSPASVRWEPGAEPAVAESDDKAKVDEARDAEANANAERKLVDELRKQQGVASGYDGYEVPAQSAPHRAREFAPSPPAPLVVPEPPAQTLAKTEAERLQSEPAEVQATGARIDEVPQQAAPSPVTGVTANDLQRAGSSTPRANSSRELQEIVVTGARRRVSGRAAGPRGTISSSAFRNDSRPESDERADRSDPKAWLEEIRELRRDGKTADADREWLRFHEAYPDFPVAEDDIARKKP